MIKMITIIIIKQLTKSDVFIQDSKYDGKNNNTTHVHTNPTHF